MEPGNDPRLQRLLHEWQVPNARDALEQRVFGRPRSWWRILMSSRGDTVAIDLLENPTTGQTVVDYLVFKRSSAAAAAAASPLRDLSLAEVELQLEDFRISWNGALLNASTRVGGSISGAVLWFYLPGQGRFVMSLLPNAKLGFRRAGEVSGRSLTFTTERQERYDIHSTSRIVPAGGRFNLYVLDDPTWRPTNDESNSPLIFGASDRAESLIPK